MYVNLYVNPYLPAYLSLWFTSLCLVIQLCPSLWNPMEYSLPGSSAHGSSPGKNTGVSCSVLLQGIFPNQGSHPGLPYWKWILYQLSPREAQEYWCGQPTPSPGDLPDLGIELGSPALQADSLPAELPRKTLFISLGNHKFVFYICNSVLYISLFVSFFKNSTHKWYHMIFVFLCLIYYDSL